MYSPPSRPHSSADAAANAAAIASPTGVASSKPAFLPSRTPGVASACSPRNEALARKPSETRKSRASRRDLAAVLAEHDARRRRAQHQPEVRRVALPAPVGLRPQQQDGEQDHRHDDADQRCDDANGAAGTGDRRGCGEHASLLRPSACRRKALP
jgi:hypothetical protein